MKAEIKEYCIRCGICVGLYPQLFAHNFEKDCIDVKYDEIPAELEETAKKCSPRLCGDGDLFEEIG